MCIVESAQPDWSSGLAPVLCAEMSVSAPTSAGVHGLVNELSSMSETLRKQSQIPNLDISLVRSSLVTAFKARVSMTAIDTHGLTMLSDVILSSAFSNSEKADLCAHVNNQVHLGSRGPDSSVKVMRMSNLPDMQLYIKQSTWDILMDENASRSAKLDAITLTWAALGMSVITEQTIKSGATILSLFLWPSDAPPSQSSLDLVRDIKVHFKAIPKSGKGHLPFLAEYPLDPTQLPEAIYAHAYAIEAPAKQRMAAYNMRSTTIPLRCSGRAVRTMAAPVRSPTGSAAGRSVDTNQVLSNLLGVLGIQMPQGLQTLSRLASSTGNSTVVVEELPSSNAIVAQGCNGSPSIPGHLHAGSTTPPMSSLQRKASDDARVVAQICDQTHGREVAPFVEPESAEDDHTVLKAQEESATYTVKAKSKKRLAEIEQLQLDALSKDFYICS